MTELAVQTELGELGSGDSSGETAPQLRIAFSGGQAVTAESATVTPLSREELIGEIGEGMDHMGG
jgi:hypothetical protein